MSKIKDNTEEKIIKWLNTFIHLDNEDIENMLDTYSSSVSMMIGKGEKESSIAVTLMTYGQKELDEIQAFAETKKRYL